MSKKKKTKQNKEVQQVEVKKAKWQPGDERATQGTWTAKYRPEFDAVASRLVGLQGFNEKDLARTFDVPVHAIKGWKRSFPSFKKACNAGKKDQLHRLADNSMKEAMGYDWMTEKTVTEYGADGEIIKTTTTKTPMHQAGNATLATFMMCNLSNQLKLDEDEAFKAKQKVEVENKNLNVNISAELVGAQIDRLAGKLLGDTKKIDSKVINTNEK